MNILMMTNTYKPHVGGVARSVESFSQEYRRQGHRVMIFAPVFEGEDDTEPDVVRLPAIQHFNGSDFSVRLPVPGIVEIALRNYRPDVIHSHHPFLVGATALRLAATNKVPIVFTHHTMYEQYTHYVPGDSDAMKRFVINLATGYANLCQHVFAPSESIAGVLRRRGVEKPITVVPTGVATDRFARGDGRAFRSTMGIPARAFVVGHLGRLAPEKNLEFLAKTVVAFLRAVPRARFLLIGTGPSEATVRSIFESAGLSKRLHVAGILTGPTLSDAYHAMDVFAFASKSETQGMVLVEAMAAGVPVVALDAPGAREVVRDGVNGRLLREESVESFAAALRGIAGTPMRNRTPMRAASLSTAHDFSISATARRALGVYETLIQQEHAHQDPEDSLWDHAMRFLKAEWEMWANVAESATAALTEAKE
ncbi:MAG: glycosyltransferase [Candidatus Sumerlaeota bacterium]|nr:glycosyltransferase [Candidatus Sumerlaeota bacterium]